MLTEQGKGGGALLVTSLMVRESSDYLLSCVLCGQL